MHVTIATQQAMLEGLSNAREDDTEVDFSSCIMARQCLRYIEVSVSPNIRPVMGPRIRGPFVGLILYSRPSGDWRPDLTKIQHVNKIHTSHHQHSRSNLYFRYFIVSHLREFGQS